MEQKMKKTILLKIYKTFASLAFLAVFVSGINHDVAVVAITISLLASCMGFVYLLIIKRGILLPKYFFLMLIFVIVLQIYLFFIKNKLDPFLYASVFANGIFYWIIFYNLENGESLIKKAFIILAIFYSTLYFASRFFNTSFFKLASLYFEQGTMLKTGHYQFANLWTIVLTAIFAVYPRRYDLKNLLLICLGGFFLLISKSRIALLALSISLVYLFIKRKSALKNQKLIKVFALISIVALFIFFSTGKTTIFDRPYFLQSIESFTKYPVGVGMGNFKIITENFHQKKPDDTSISVYAHNLYLESLSGVGIFSIIFIVFLALIFKDVLKAGEGAMSWGAVLLAFLSIFMIDYTYTIPGIIWLFFMSLGVFQKKQNLLSS